jgi:hypothetical protein
MASRLKSSQVREGAKALQPLALVALIGIVGTVALLGGCGGGSNSSGNTEPTPIVPSPITSGSPSPTPSGGVTPTPTPTSSSSPTPTPSGSTSPTPSPTPTPSMLTLTQALDALKSNAKATINAFALGPDNGWAVVYTIAADDTTTPPTPATTGYYIPIDAPESLRTALNELLGASARIRSITLGAGDVWLITYNQASDGYTQHRENNIDANMFSRLVNLQLNQNVNINSAIIGANPATWALIVNQNLNYSQGLPAGLQTQLDTFAANANITVNYVALGADNTYAVAYNTNQILGTATGLVNAVNGQNFTLTGIGLGLAGSYAATYNQNQYLAAGTTRSR